MSYTRRVRVSVAVDITKDRCLDVNLPPILPRERMLELLAESLERDGWSREGDELSRNDDRISRRFDEQSGEVTVEVTKHARATVDERDGNVNEQVERQRGGEVSKAVDTEVEELRKKFREQHVPEALADAVTEKARILDPAARVSKSEDNERLVVTIELECDA